MLFRFLSSYKIINTSLFIMCFALKKTPGEGFLNNFPALQ